MSKINVTLGIDIGGTNTVLGLVTKEGECIKKSCIPTNAMDTAEDLFKRIFAEFEVLLPAADGNYNLVGIGIGAPNANYYSGCVENPPNLNWGTVNIIELVKKYKDVPTALTNDANAAALGELKFGVARGMKNFIEMTLGTGLGSGIVVDGKLLYGHDGFAGEIGHTIAVRDGRKCGCGRKGCLEAYVSAGGIKRTVFELLVQSSDRSVLRDISYNELTSKKIYEAAVNGDKIANTAFKVTGKYLGESLADSVAHLSPEAIVLFGGLSQAGDLLLDSVKKNLENSLLNIFKGKVKILVSGLPEGDAAVLGSGALIWHELNNQ
ncbi:MAG: ROK family protein [Bacteroidetes bacterium]|nr:ROK family protein [Bacteroidota bacterium]MBU1680202.1 ROK family protein [Bacteroidota bacterium]